MPKIDIGAVLRQKAPRLARWIPRPVVNWLRRTIHESEINHILEHYWSLPPQEFIRACFREWQVTYRSKDSTSSPPEAVTSSPRTIRSGAWTA